MKNLLKLMEKRKFASIFILIFFYSNYIYTLIIHKQTNQQ